MPIASVEVIMDPSIDPSDIPDIHTNTDSATDNIAKRISIVDDGDEILIVGKESTIFKVSSAILAISSSVFSAIFKTGTSSTQPKEFPLPDDHAPSMEIILRVLHHRIDDIPECLMPWEVLSVALLAEKYNCIGPLRYISSVWTELRDVTGIEQLGQLMSAAYIFRNDTAFSNLTLALMTTIKEGYHVLAQLLVMDAAPLWQIIYRVEEGRARMRTQLQQILLHTSWDASNCRQNCDICKKSIESPSYSFLLAKRDLTPEGIQNMSIEEALTGFEIMKAPAVKPKPCSKWVSIISPTVKERKEQRLDSFIQRCEGLCRGCVRNGITGKTEECLTTHSWPSLDVGAYEDCLVPAKP